MAEASKATENPPKTRRAWKVVRRGPPAHALSLDNLVPMPKLKKGEVLVRVQAAALNPVGYKLMKLLPNFVVRRPAIAEYDLAGIVADANGTGFKVGEAVFGWNPPTDAIKNGEGALSEFVKVPAIRLVRTPGDFTATDVAGLSLAGLTAYQGLINKAGIEAGHVVFINGGSSSVGRFAIQIAKAKGCKVVTSCSPSNIDNMKSLGADEVLDYTVSSLHEQLAAKNPCPKYHAILEAIGLPGIELYTFSPSYLDPKGCFVTVGPQGHDFTSIVQSCVTLLRGLAHPTWLGGVPRKFKLISVEPSNEDLEELCSLLREGKVKPQVDSIFAFDDVLKAYERIQTNKAKGKVIVTIP